MTIYIQRHPYTTSECVNKAALIGGKKRGHQYVALTHDRQHLIKTNYSDISVKH